MKRRRLLLGAAVAPAAGGLVARSGLASLAGLAAWAGPARAAADLPAVLQRPAAATALAPQAALLAAASAGPRLLVAGERGIVLGSDDGDAQWAQASVPVQASLTALAFQDAQRGWAAGHFGVLLATEDGGRRWRLAMDGQRAAQLLLEGAADDTQRQQAQRRAAEGPDKPFFDIAFAGDRLLAVGAYGLALESRDGRVFQPLAHRLPNPRQLHLYAVQAVGERVFIVGEQGLILRSTDRGASFEALPPPYKGSFFGLQLVGPGGGTVLAYGLRGNVWRSADGGASWHKVAVPLPVSIGAGTVRPDGSVVLAAQNGDLLLSRDEGRSFQHRPASPPFPAAALVAAGPDALLLAGLRGLKRLPLA